MPLACNKDSHLFLWVTVNSCELQSLVKIGFFGKEKRILTRSFALAEMCEYVCQLFLKFYGYKFYGCKI